MYSLFNVKRRWYVCLFLTFAHLSAIGQLRIVKDNIACAYGLKNEKSEWVIQAIYTSLVQDNNGYYYARQGEGMGMLSSKGEVIIPLKYDQVKLIRHKRDGNNAVSQLFLVGKKYLYGLADSSGTLILPISYNSIQIDRYNRIVAHRSEEEQPYTSYFDTDGTLLFPEVKGRGTPFEEKNIAIIGSYASKHGASENAGAINIKGEEVIPRDYESLEFCTKQIMGKKDGKVGALDYSGKVVLPFKYNITRKSSYRNLPCFSGTGFWTIYEDQKYGLVNEKAQLILSADYSSLTPVGGQHRFKNYGWLVLKDKKWGTIKRNGTIGLTAEYDTLIPYNPYYIKPSGQTELHMYFIYGKNGKYGIMNDTGKVVSPPIFDHYFRGAIDREPVFYLSNKYKLFAHNLKQHPDSLIALSYLNKSDSVVLYTYKGNLYPFVSGKNSKGELTSPLSNGYDNVSIGNLLAVSLRSKLLLFDKTGKRIDNDKYRRIDKHRGRYLEVHTNTNKIGLMSPKTGKLICDTAYSEFSQSAAANTWVWARLHVDWNDPKKNKKEGWVLIDSTGKRQIKEVFLTQYGANDFVPATTRKGTGLLNAREAKWIIKPGYKTLELTGENLYLAASYLGKMGLVGN